MKTWRTTMGAIGAAALLAACGGDDSGFADQSPEEILAATEADMKGLSSLRMTGDVTTDGDEVSIDMALSTTGDCAGSISQGGATAEIISIDGTSYMRPDAAFWEMFAGDAAPQVSELVGDRWVLVPGEDGDFSEFCDLDRLLEDLDDEDDSEEATVEGVEEVDGREAVRISSTTEEGDPVTAWVATEAPHVILRMEVTQGEEPGTITFSDFDEDIDVEAPPEDQVVDLNQLG